ncbi:MAG: hypothetical protein K8S99_03535 [Planctomycetes bacterium]|nr:hypothetical protein [Planctomycetota bacterium]
MTTTITRPIPSPGFMAGMPRLLLMQAHMAGVDVRNNPICRAAVTEMHARAADDLGIVRQLHARGVGPVDRAAIERERARIEAAGEPLPSIALPWAGIDADSERTPEDDADLRDRVGGAQDFLDARAKAEDSRRKREIRAHLAFLAKVHADRRARQSPDYVSGGPSLAPALIANDGRDRHLTDPKRWAVALHESGHACVGEALAPNSVKYVEVHAGGTSGVCQCQGEMDATKEAVMTASGVEAEFRLGDAKTTRMQSGNKTLDSDQFFAALTRAKGEPVCGLEPEAVSALCTSEFCVRDNTASIYGVAKLLFDNGRIEGESVRTVMGYHAGRYDETLEDAFWAARRAGEGWEFSRGFPKNFH